VVAPSDSPLRVVIVDDSAFIVDSLVKVVEEDRACRVVGTAGNGAEAVQVILQKRPDVVTCDLSLPKMDGFEVVAKVMAEAPLPILILTATLRPQWRKDAFDALRLGAVDVMEKPRAAQLADPAWRDGFRKQLRLIARSTVVSHLTRRAKPEPRTPRAAPRRRPSKRVALPRPASVDRLVTVVGSAGSPRALSTLLEGLRPGIPFSAPVLVALHIGPDMADSYVTHLGARLACPVELVCSGELLVPGTVYVTPGDHHIEITDRQQAHLLEEVPGAIFRPCFDHLFSSVAAEYGPDAAAVILSGMGGDGAQGILAVKEAGGLTLGQDEETAIIYGMPRVAQEKGALALQLSPERIASELLDWLGHG